MKKLLTLFVGILFTAHLFAQAIPNGGFENWNNVTWYDLANYQTSNDQYISKGFGLSGINAARSTSAFHGNYSLQLTTLKIGSDTLIAYATNGINNPIQAMGGIPYNQKPTGISFHYTSNIMAGDTAAVIAIFKKSGIGVIGGYLFPITVTKSTYTLYTKTLSPALPLNPDTVIFAAVSSLAAVYDNNYSKGCIPGNALTLDSVNFTGASVTQPALLNGDFENWKADTVYVPSGWNSAYPGTFQSTDHFAGNYAVQLTTVLAPNTSSGAQTGIITTGNLQNYGTGGNPYTLTNDTLEFYYKYAPAMAGDSGTVSLIFKKNGSLIGNGGMKLGPVSNYTLQKVGFTTSLPDTVIVTFTSSTAYNPPTSYIGSVLKVDNAMFKSSPLSVLNLSAVTGISIYPNPVTNSFSLNIEKFSGAVESVDVYDITGKTVLSDNFGTTGFNSTVTNFDMSKTKPGIYIVKVLTSKGVFYQKISKIE